MVQNSAQIRRQGPHDFLAYYEFLCAKQDSVPVNAVKINLDKGMLDFNGDKLKLVDWPPILGSISINKHLRHIAISSTFQGGLAFADSDISYGKYGSRRKIPPICSKDMTFKLCKALRECLTVSPCLKTLHLHGLPLRERDLITLTKGLAESSSVENVSLANCPISDNGLEIICQSVKYSTSIRSVDFTGCNLTWIGAEHMANIIKHQAMQRHSAAWAESLRYRLPQFDVMSGLRRITLNGNSLIGDRGAAALAHELTEDLWVKAVDLQKCGLSNEGARRLLEALKTNSSLCVLDIRNNPLVDKVLIKTVIEKVLMIAKGQSSEYCWIKPTSTESQKASGPKRGVIPVTVRRRSTYRKGTSGGQSSAVAQPKKLSSRSSMIPWRAAARAGRQRGLPPGVTVLNQSFEGAAAVEVTVESDSEGEDSESEEVVVEVGQTSSSLGATDRITGQQYDRIQMELKECRLSLAAERRARLRAESRLKECELEKGYLRDANRSLSEALGAPGSGSALRTFSSLEDESVLESIENSFNKFHAFLDLLKDAGLGQLASMAGINTSDFQPLGKPQLSSTVGPQQEAAASTTAGQFRDVQAQSHNASLAGRVTPFPPGAAAFFPTCQPPSLHKDRLVDVTFNHTGLDAAAPALPGEEEPHQYFRPATQPDSGSEHSQKSFEHFPFGKTFQSRPSRQEMEASSNRSSSYHGNSISNNSMYSGESQINSTHGGFPESVSEIMSDKGESLGSVGSVSSGNRRLMFGQPGSERSEGSERGAYSLNQIGSLGGQSVDKFL
ncbi:centrosomal protein of 78 kDa isoform X2 [Poecilia latipinna]|uniref:centrosomal protein of 78 kDa isoform X2 n=1 Tax=Poecilia latipinna TaxID=48699 RepID=UPI00072EB2F1|nr:PREDICTED: centrosomal protein of 78 kDa isoform X2 [Poecilia latipinna]